MGSIGQYKKNGSTYVWVFGKHFEKVRELEIGWGGTKKYLCFCSRATEVRRFVARELPKEIVDFTGLDIFGKASDE